MTINERINQIAHGNDGLDHPDCTCCFDYQDERYVRSNPKTLCKVHDWCDLCGERPATTAERWEWSNYSGPHSQTVKMCEVCEKETNNNRITRP